MVNYELLQQQQIRDGVLSILIEAIVKHKMIISTRSMLNFIYDILVPSHGNEDFLGAGMMEKPKPYYRIYYLMVKKIKFTSSYF